jgi:hypothetical protein
LEANNRRWRARLADPADPEPRCAARYLALVHRSRFRIPKELLAAFLFTAGTFVVALANAPDPFGEQPQDGMRRGALYLIGELWC